MAHVLTIYNLQPGRIHRAWLATSPTIPFCAFPDIFQSAPLVRQGAAAHLFRDLSLNAIVFRCPIQVRHHLL